MFCNYEDESQKKEEYEGNKISLLKRDRKENRELRY